AATQEAGFESLEIAVAHQVNTHMKPFARRLTLDLELRFPTGPGWNSASADGGSLNARECPDMIQHFAEKGRALAPLRVTCCRERNEECHYALRIVTEPLLLKCQQAANSEPCTGQQH